MEKILRNLRRAALVSFFFGVWGLNFSGNIAFALPQYQRLLKQEYGFKAPCATCHSQGGGSSLSTYGKAFERAGKGRLAITSIAGQIPKGDTFDFGAKLKAKANPNDPKSTPSSPGDWAGKSDLPLEELKTFAPSEIEKFTVLEGELKDDQVAKLKERLGDAYTDEDKFPVFYFGEVGGKKTYVVQYVRVPKLKKTLGFVVSTQGAVVGLAYVGATKSPIPEVLKNNTIGKKRDGVEQSLKSATGDDKLLLEGVYRGLSAIQLVFGGGK